MRNIEIIKHYKVINDDFYILAITDERGTHTETISKNMLLQGLAKNMKVHIDEENKELFYSVYNSSIEYMEIAEINENDETIYDVYIHKAVFDDNLILFDYYDNHIKTYKNIKSAKNFADKMKIKYIIYT